MPLRVPNATLNHMVKPMSSRSTALALALCAFSVVAQPAFAQGGTTADAELQSAEAAMSSCSAAAAARRHPEALADAKVAETVFRSRLALRPNEVRTLVGLARTLGACRIPSADLALAGELSAESIELLQRALEVEPNHWLARYMLALNYYRAPAFLGRSKDAARELDRLIAQQGERNDVREYARPYEYRGTLWLRSGWRDSAVVVWQRGHQLFPGDTALRARLGLGAESAAATHPVQPAPQAAPAPATAPPASQDAQVPATTAPATTAPAAATGAAVARSRIETVRVVESRASAASVQPSPSERQLTRSDVVMSAGGMADVLLAAQLQPGATRVGEGAELFTRGGDPAETPTFIDGGRILSVARFEGLSGSTFGALDPWVVKTARFSTGGFSVQRGNALSGVLDIETDGRPRSREWRAGVGLAQGGATARLPLGARTGAWGTVRGTHAGALLRTHGRAGEFTNAPYSLEAMGAFIAQPTLGNEYRAMGMMVRDASARVVDANGYSGAFDSRGTTHALILSSQHLGRTRPVVVRSNVALSERHTEWSFGVLARERTERNGIARLSMEYAPGEWVTIRSGVEGGALSRADAGALPASPAVAPGSPTRPLASTDSSTTHVGGYAESEMVIGRYRVLAGARADQLPGESDVTVDPRISISTRFAGWTTRLSAGEFHQGRWRAEASIPDPGTPSGLPRQARHLVAGVEREGAVSLKAEAFVKAYGEYAAFGAGPRVVDGTARGVDLIMQRQAGGRVTGWLGYSLLDSEVTLADGRSARSPYDVTHTASGSGTLRLARGTTLGSSIRFGTGRPVTPIVGAREAPDGRVEPVYGTPMSERLPAYSRWDARLTQYVPLRRSLLVTFVEVLNVLDRENVAGYVWDSAYHTRRSTNTFYSERTLMVGFELQSR